MNKTKKTETKTPEVFTRFTINGHAVDVVPAFDDLPLAGRRKLRGVMVSRGLNQHQNEYEMLINYALSYAALQGVSINLDGIQDEATSLLAEEQAFTAGLRLWAHFNPVTEAGAEGKSTPEPGPEAQEASPSN